MLSAAMTCGSDRTWSSNAASRPRVVPRQRGRHPDLQREARQGRVDVRPDDPDDAGVLERPHPVQRRGGGQADQPGELDVGAVRVRLQLGEQLNVNFIKLDGHIAKLYFVKAVRWQMMTGHDGTMRDMNTRRFPVVSHPDPCRRRARRRGRGLGDQRPAVQGRAGVAAARLAGRGPVRARRRGAARHGEPRRAARGAALAGTGLGRRRARRLGPGAERRASPRPASRTPRCWSAPGRCSSPSSPPPGTTTWPARSPGAASPSRSAASPWWPRATGAARPPAATRWSSSPRSSRRP